MTPPDDPDTESVDIPNAGDVPLPPSDCEFEDEPPGAYLRGLRLGLWALIWNVAHFAAAVLVAAVWLTGGADPADRDAWALLAVLWALVPVSASIGVLCVFAVGRYSDRGFGFLGGSSLALGVATLAVWGVLRFGLEVEFPLGEDSPPVDASVGRAASPIDRADHRDMMLSFGRPAGSAVSCGPQSATHESWRRP